MAVTRDGIPVRVWCWPGNTSDSPLIRQVKDELRDWTLGKVIWVADRGFTSAENRRHLAAGGHGYILGEKLRSGSPEARAALSRQGRYQDVRQNLRVKEVKVCETERFIVCHNPAAADRDAAIRQRLIDRLQALIDGSDTLPPTKRAELRGVISTKPGLHRYLRSTPSGLLRLDAAKVAAEARLDGKYLLRTADPHLSAEDIALGYKQLLEVERGWRDMKQLLDLRPVFHRLEDRIRAHVLLCWLALLLARIVETRTAHHLDPRPRPVATPPRGHLHRPRRHLPPDHRPDRRGPPPARGPRPGPAPEDPPPRHRTRHLTRARRPATTRNLVTRRAARRARIPAAHDTYPQAFTRKQLRNPGIIAGIFLTGRSRNPLRPRARGSRFSPHGAPTAAARRCQYRSLQLRPSPPWLSRMPGRPSLLAVGLIPFAGDGVVRLRETCPVLLAAVEVQPVGRLRKLQESVNAGDHDTNVDREDLKPEEGHTHEDVDDHALVEDEVDDVGKARIAMPPFHIATGAASIDDHRHGPAPPAPE